MNATRIFETILYAENLQQAKIFYTEVMGLTLTSETETRLLFRLPESVLLIFDPRSSSLPNRPVPPHGARGAGHIAFALEKGEYENWISHFKEKHIQIEKIVEWEDGDASLYLRDPAGNSLELAPSTLWGGDWDF